MVILTIGPLCSVHLKNEIHSKEIIKKVKYISNIVIHTQIFTYATEKIVSFKYTVRTKEKYQILDWLKEGLTSKNSQIIAVAERRLDYQCKYYA